MGLSLCIHLVLVASAPARTPHPDGGIAPELIRLKGLSVVQQTTDHTCGPAIAVGVARYLGMEADEMTVAREMATSPRGGTNPQQMAGWFITKGFKVRWGENGTIDMLKDNLAKGIPTLVEWIDWGGHWVVVAGIDDKGTVDTDDDDIIFADPWDRIDGVADGYTRFNLDRFESMWFDAFLFHRPMRKIFIAVERP
jgi:ABC-type bacteriocin/lantibiotic exporter with double-glycine peptidase domain